MTLALGLLILSFQRTYSLFLIKDVAFAAQFQPSRNQACCLIGFIGTVTRASRVFLRIPKCLYDSTMHEKQVFLLKFL